MKTYRHNQDYHSQDHHGILVQDHLDQHGMHQVVQLGGEQWSSVLQRLVHGLKQKETKLFAEN